MLSSPFVSNTDLRPLQHVFCTEDGYALDVFVVQGWKGDDATNLNAHLQRRLETINWDEVRRRRCRLDPGFESNNLFTKLRS